MRRITLLLPLLFLGPAGCSVAVTGAPCDTTDECPAGEVCGEGGACREKREGEEGNCECRPGESQRCAGDGTRVTCREDEICPFYPEGGGVADVVCECAAPGDGEGDGCSALDTRVCSNGGVLQCKQVGACLRWQPVEDCGAKGLNCGTPSEKEGVQCVCPSNRDATTFFVDPAHGNRAGQGVRPTGLEEPAKCRFARVTDAFAAIPTDATVTVVVTGFDRKKWEPDRRFKAQETVIPPPRNGWLYQAKTDGKSGAVAPKWPTQVGDTVTDGDIEWENVGRDAVRLEEETFPLTVPPSVTLTTADCPAGGGNGCEPFKYALAFGLANGGDQSPTALSLSANASVSGLAIQDAGGRMAASAVYCAAGKVTLEDVWLQGSESPTPRMQVGVAVGDTCEPTLRRSVIGLFSQAGLLSQTTGKVTLEQVEIGTGRGIPLPAGSGVRVMKGQLDARDTTIAHASQQGMYIGGSTTQVTLTRSVVRANGINSATPDASLPGITLNDGTLTLLGTSAEENGGAGLRVEGGQVTAGPFDGRNSTFNKNGLTNQTPASNAAGVQMLGGILDADPFPAAQNRFHGLRMGGGAVARLKNVGIGGNGQHGIYFETDAELDVVGGWIKANGEDNVHVSQSVRYAEASFTNANISEATGGAGMTLHGGNVHLTNTIVASNSGAGIDAPAAGYGPTVTITGSTQVLANGGTGVNAAKGTWSLTGATIKENGRRVSGAVGMRVASDAKLSVFSGNQLYSNQRAQLRFEGSPAFLQEWVIPARCNDATANQLSCYPPQAVGLDIANGAVVNAQGLLFKNGPPVSGTDYNGSFLEVHDLCSTAAPMSCP